MTIISTAVFNLVVRGSNLWSVEATYGPWKQPMVRESNLRSVEATYGPWKQPMVRESNLGGP